jgi:hypothetical protein
MNGLGPSINKSLFAISLPDLFIIRGMSDLISVKAPHWNRLTQNVNRWHVLLRGPRSGGLAPMKLFRLASCIRCGDHPASLGKALYCRFIRRG